MKIGVLLATFNRKEKTLACLKSLYNQKNITQAELIVYLTDDNSSDGTASAVAAEFPAVNLFKGSGQLFWAGGMRSSWGKAVSDKLDYYLLLNDDTVLMDTAINQLLKYFETNTEPAICVGSTMESDTGKISYGGQKLYNKNKVQCYTIYSDTEYMECDMANANIMLVPAAIVQKIGILSPAYTHSIADFDYSLRAQKAGYKVLVVPGILGYCVDDHGQNWKSADASLADRIKYLKSPKGLAYKEYMHFIKTHFPSHVPATFVKLWMKTLFPVIWDRFKN